MRAFRLTSPHKTELTSTPQPDPRPGEVLIKVGAAGVCHSDLHIIDAPVGAGFPIPLTLGHENAGWVEALGTGVTGWEKGEPVAIYGIIGCGHCRACLRGRDNECRVKPVGGIGLSQDGGMAEYVRVPAAQLLRIGDLDVTQAAPLTDAGLTPYHAIELSRDALRPGTTCVVIGVGGLGHMAIQILAATTSVRIIAVDVRDAALKTAATIGAHHTVRSDEDASRHIRELVGPLPGGADVVLDFVGATPTLKLAASVISTGGKLMLVGLAGGELKLTPSVDATGVPMEAQVVIPFWGTRAELAEVIALARSGRIVAHTKHFALSDAPAAYNELRSEKLEGRAVVTPWASY
ncbi:MAG: NAD(P)-dependent alcohol dehydrogenase [Acidobacteriaceae bacterium]